jgi:hypothetical protein
MPLKVVPAGDERCDVHNERSPQNYVCETCLRKFGIDPTQPSAAERHRRSRVPRPLRRALRRWRSPSNRRVRIGVGIAALVGAAIIVAALILGGGGGKNTNPSESEVVETLQLIPSPSGTGWITSDGTCSVPSIVTGSAVRPGNVAEDLAVEVTNESQTVGAVVTPNVSSFFQATVSYCVDQVGTALKDNF